MIPEDGKPINYGNARLAMQEVRRRKTRHWVGHVSPAAAVRERCLCEKSEESAPAYRDE